MNKTIGILITFMLSIQSIHGQVRYDEHANQNGLPVGIFYQAGPGATNTSHWQYSWGSKITVNVNNSRNFEICTTEYPCGQLVFRQWDPFNVRWIPWRQLLMADTLGNVGIGTSTPQSKLAVSGEITAKKLRVIQTGWPDFVFDSTYTLPPLSTTEDYIQSEHHLLDIPSANDIKAGGLDIGEMQKKQMQKIEELTLYLIEMNKKMKAMEIQIKELKATNDELLEQAN